MKKKNISTFQTRLPELKFVLQWNESDFFKVLHALNVSKSMCVRHNLSIHDMNGVHGHLDLMEAVHFQVVINTLLYGNTVLKGKNKHYKSNLILSSTFMRLPKIVGYIPKATSGPRQANLCLRAFRHDKF